MIKVIKTKWKDYKTKCFIIWSERRGTQKKEEGQNISIEYHSQESIGLEGEDLWISQLPPEVFLSEKYNSNGL